jgi:hypothetical protein
MAVGPVGTLTMTESGTTRAVANVFLRLNDAVVGGLRVGALVAGVVAVTHANAANSLELRADGSEREAAAAISRARGSFESRSVRDVYAPVQSGPTWWMVAGEAGQHSLAFGHVVGSNTPFAVQPTPGSVGGAQVQPLAQIDPITPVPEPGTYAMILAGLALMVSMIRRRAPRD